MVLANALFVSWAAAVAISDCRFRRVPNALIAAGLLAAVGCALAHASPFRTAPLSAALGATLGFAVLMPFFLLRVMGAGDVKVFAVLGAWCGASALLGLWLVASVSAALHALALLVVTRSSRGPLWRRREPTFALGRFRATPYAALLAGAAILSMLAQPLGHTT